MKKFAYKKVADHFKESGELKIKFSKCGTSALDLIFPFENFSVFGISFKSFGWGKNVIVSFLTLDEIRKFFVCDRECGDGLSIENKLNMSRMLKYTLLMSDLERIKHMGCHL